MLLTLAHAGAAVHGHGDLTSALLGVALVAALAAARLAFRPKKAAHSHDGGKTFHAHRVQS